MIKRIVCLQICAILLLFLTGCYTDWMPQKGDWFCEELQIQISFDDGESYLVYDGEKMPCDCINDRGSKSFFVISQAFGIDDLPVGAELFSAEYVELTDTDFLVKEETTGTEYLFVKVNDTFR